jgi:hypothetical protein
MSFNRMVRRVGVSGFAGARGTLSGDARAGNKNRARTGVSAGHLTGDR